VLTIGGAYWVQHAELLAMTTQVSESVPPIPAVSGLLLLLAVNWAIGKVRRGWALSRGQLLVVYAFLVISVPMSSVGVVRLLGPLLTVPRYFATAENR